MTLDFNLLIEKSNLVFNDEQAKLVSAFPGTGKSYIFNNVKDKVILDSDSSKFDKEYFPDNYITHIKENINKADLILISSHKPVRDALVANDLYFNLVYPDISLKDDYIQRYIQRGSPEKFVELLKNNWEIWITECESQYNCNHIKLNKDEYLIDIIDKFV